MKIPNKINADYYNEDGLSRRTVGEQGLADKIDEVIDYLHFLTKKLAKKKKNK